VGDGLGLGRVLRRVGQRIPGAGNGATRC
jgi:hypothetical protein